MSVDLYLKPPANRSDVITPPPPSPKNPDPIDEKTLWISTWTKAKFNRTSFECFLKIKRKSQII